MLLDRILFGNFGTSEVDVFLFPILYAMSVTYKSLWYCTTLYVNGVCYIEEPERQDVCVKGCHICDLRPSSMECFT